MQKRYKTSESLLLNELQVLLSEKRTYFSILRTGLAIVTVPFTVIIFLVATATYHHLFENTWFGAALIAILLGISVAGTYISYQASLKIGKLNNYIRTAEKHNKRIDEIIV
jgi:uncharacterized membrane protein YidH (DUF202 family)